MKSLSTPIPSPFHLFLLLRVCGFLDPVSMQVSKAGVDLLQETKHLTFCFLAQVLSAPSY